MSTAEVIEAYERYLEAFLADDLAAIDALVQYPLAYIGDGEVSMLDRWPFKPSTLRRLNGLHTSIDMAYEVIGLSATKGTGMGAKARESWTSPKNPRLSLSGRSSPLSFGPHPRRDRHAAGAVGVPPAGASLARTRPGAS